MLALLLTMVMLFQTGSNANTSTQPATENGAKNGAIEDDSAALLRVRRIFVESFGDNATSREVQSMVVTSLVETKHFKVTENRERADAILKGVAIEKTSQELHSYGEATAVRGAAIGDSSAHTETLNEARVSIRLVSPDGDVIWTTTQESKGAKYKGASGDVAERCVKQLIRDVEKLEGASKASAVPGASPAPGPQH